MNGPDVGKGQGRRGRRGQVQGDVVEQGGPGGIDGCWRRTLVGVQMALRLRQEVA
jgi:hypothetical protein